LRTTVLRLTLVNGKKLGDTISCMRPKKLDFIQLYPEQAKPRMTPAAKVLGVSPTLRRACALILGIGLLQDSPTACAQSPSAVSPPEKLEMRLREVVDVLSRKIGERNLFRPDALNRAAEYLQLEAEKNGYRVDRQSFAVRSQTCHNLVVSISGQSHAQEIVIIGAHYDTARGTPGANDNASGVAALVVLCEMLAKEQFQRTVRFVFFTNEEPPYFQSKGEMGSSVYAQSCKDNNEDIRLVLSLETMGYYSDTEGSQRYPPILSRLYPSTGNFIGFVSNLESKPQLDAVIRSFKRHSNVPAYGGALPGEMQGVGWSDHWSFWQQGYAGIMVTDTALFRYPHYHQPSDTIDKIDFVRLAKVVEGLAKTIRDFADPYPP
jgi:Peptidase family M28